MTRSPPIYLFLPRVAVGTTAFCDRLGIHLAHEHLCTQDTIILAMDRTDHSDYILQPTLWLARHCRITAKQTILRKLRGACGNATIDRLSVIRVMTVFLGDGEVMDALRQLQPPHSANVPVGRRRRRQKVVLRLS